MRDAGRKQVAPKRKSPKEQKPVFGWLAFVVLSFAIGIALGTKQIDTNDANVGQPAHGAPAVA
jgi:hypothetical protein